MVFSHFSRGQKKREDRRALECGPGCALELIHAQRSSNGSNRVDANDDVWVRTDTPHGPCWKKLLSDHWRGTADAVGYDTDGNRGDSKKNKGPLTLPHQKFLMETSMRGREQKRVRRVEYDKRHQLSLVMRDITSFSNEAKG